MKLISNKEIKCVKLFKKSYFSLLRFFYKEIKKSDFEIKTRISQLHKLNISNFLLSGYFVFFWYIISFISNEGKKFKIKNMKNIFLSYFSDNIFFQEYFEFSLRLKEQIIDNSNEIILLPEELKIKFDKHKEYFLQFALSNFSKNNVNNELIKLFISVYDDLFLFTVYEWYTTDFKFLFEYKKNNAFEYEKNSKVVSRQLELLSNAQLKIRENKFLSNFNNLFILLTSIRKNIVD